MNDEPHVPPEAQAALQRAQAQREAGHLDAALNECDAALRAAPHWAEAHSLRGILLDGLGRTREAAAAYRRALRLDPTLRDAATNLARGRPLERRVGVGTLVVCFVLAMVVVAALVVMQAHRGPDWRPVLNEYIAQSASPGEAEPMQRATAARRPDAFTASMGRAARGDVLWDLVTPEFPPEAVQCVLLDRSGSTGGAQRREVVYVAYHNDGQFRVGWRVYRAGEAPFSAQLQADLQTLGCDLDLE